MLRLIGRREIKDSSLRRAASLLLAVLSFSGASSSYPEGSDNPYRVMFPSLEHSPKIRSYYDKGFASDKEIAARVGRIKITMDACKSGQGRDRRVVRVDLSRSDVAYPKVVDGILFKAAEFAWQNCPQAKQLNIAGVNIYLPDGSLAYTARLGDFVYGDGILGPAEEYHWHIQRDGIAEARQRAEENASRARQAVEAQQRAEANARSAAARDQFWSNVWLGIKLLFWGAIAAWLFSKREIIMRWYYLLTPHPAKAMVETAVHTGAELDGKAFAEIMRPIPGGRIEKEVRAEQARKLAEKAHSYAESMRAKADRIKAKAQQDAEFIRAQDDLVKAATVHEKAKARLDALRKLVG